VAPVRAIHLASPSATSAGERALESSGVEPRRLLLPLAELAVVGVPEVPERAHARPRRDVLGARRGLEQLDGQAIGALVLRPVQRIVGPHRQEPLEAVAPQLTVGTLVGSASGRTLFLDEIGELPQPLLARLLRVPDDGEYQRLGDDGTRRADLRRVAATNRALDELEFELAARLTLEVQTPPPAERREDIPLGTGPARARPGG
jgi:Sigma-54 interaction domain